MSLENQWLEDVFSVFLGDILVFGGVIANEWFMPIYKDGSPEKENSIHNDERSIMG